jgi:hypothetical protein
MSNLVLAASQIKPIIDRHDVVRDDCPEHIKKHLAFIGGRNIYGEPIFRCVRMEKTFRKISLENPIFADDADPTQAIPIQKVAELLNSGVPHREALEEGALVSKRNLTPLRTVVGEQWFPKYPVQGVVLERWQPASFYGSAVEWEAIHVARFPFLGAFPQFGDYEMIGDFVGSRRPWPSIQLLTSVIRRYREQQKKQPEDLRTRLLTRAYCLEVQARKKYEQLEKYFDDLLKDEFTGKYGMLNRVSLAAGRYRQELADRAGIKEWAGN